VEEEKKGGKVFMAAVIPRTSLTVLPQCGPKSIEKLNHQGIFTCEELLACSTLPDGITMKKWLSWKEACQKLGSQPHGPEAVMTSYRWMTEKHSWYHKNAHLVTLKHKRVQLGRILQYIWLEDGRMGLRVLYHTRKVRILTPMTLAAWYRLWQISELVSDDEPSASLFTSVKADELPSLHVESIDKNVNAADQGMKQLKSQCQETNGILFIQPE
jgi:hypothetical protein